MALGAKMHC